MNHKLNFGTSVTFLNSCAIMDFFFLYGYLWICQDWFKQYTMDNGKNKSHGGITKILIAYLGTN